jgi:hypothetical protein
VQIAKILVHKMPDTHVIMAKRGNCMIKSLLRATKPSVFLIIIHGNTPNIRRLIAATLSVKS